MYEAKPLKPAGTETVTSETELLRELHAEQREMKRRGIIIPFAIHTPDLSVVLALISNLQLALKHPENNGFAAEVARRTIDGLKQIFAEAGYPAHVTLIELGEPGETTPKGLAWDSLKQSLKM